MGVGLGFGLEHRSAALDALDGDRHLEQTCRVKAVGPSQAGGVCAKGPSRVKNTPPEAQVGAGLRDGDRDRIRAGAGATAGPVVRVVVEGRVRVLRGRGEGGARAGVVAPPLLRHALTSAHAEQPEQAEDTQLCVDHLG